MTLRLVHIYFDTTLYISAPSLYPTQNPKDEIVIAEPYYNRYIHTHFIHNNQTNDDPLTYISNSNIYI